MLCYMLETLRSSTFHLRMPHRCSIGFRSGDMLGQSIIFTLSILEGCLGSLCLNTALWPRLRREGIMLCFSMSVCRATILFFRSSKSSLPWGAMLNFQWPVWESESNNTKFNTLAPHSHLRPCNTNESHDTGERKWLIGPNFDIFT